MVCALSTLKNLTTEPANMEGMWNDEGVRGALVGAAAATAEAAAEVATDARARAVALGALRNIASATPNKAKMWGDECGTRAAVVAAAGVSGQDLSSEARESRMHALAALRYFASISEEAADGPLWADCEPAKAALVAAAKLSAIEHTDHKAREYAVAALRYAA